MKKEKQKARLSFFAFTLFVFVLSLSLPALAADGFNSSAGTDLPLGAGGAAPTMIIKNGTGNVGIKNNDPQAALDVGGGVRVANENLCNAQKTGTLRYTSDKLQICDAASLQWKEVGVGGCNPGQCTKSDGTCGNVYVDRNLNMHNFFGPVQLGFNYWQLIITYRAMGGNGANVYLAYYCY